jgi:hypothetical protein
MPRRLMLYAFIAALGGCTAAEAGAAAVTRISYHGWHNAYRLSNGTVELVFVPQLGRIMRYAYAGGRNMLWENRALDGKVTDRKHPPHDWQNYGGDKLWPAPQVKWGWPPDPVLDSGMQRVDILPGGRLRITGQFSRRYGVRFVRVISLDPQGTGVRIENRMENAGRTPVEWSVWEVAQTDDPDAVSVPATTRDDFPEGYHVLGDEQPSARDIRVEENSVVLRRSRVHSFKIGCDSPTPHIVARSGLVQFLLDGPGREDGEYPDDGCTAELYSSQDPAKYVEAELLGPIRRIAPHAESRFVTRWRLARIPRRPTPRAGAPALRTPPTP